MRHLLRLAVVMVSTAVLLFMGCDSDVNPTAPSFDSQNAQSELTGHSSVGESSFLDEGPGPDGPDENSEGEDNTSCARSPGFFCQNKDGKNSNMTLDQFRRYAQTAARLLFPVDELNSPRKIAMAVCDTSDQLFRHLATLALNIAAGFDPDSNFGLDRTTRLIGEEFRGRSVATVGDALALAIDAADGFIDGERVTRSERKEIKNILDRINNNVNVEGECGPDDQDNDEDDGEVDDGLTACGESSGKITICHKGKNTISISVSAWPAHEAHGDTCGACSTQ